MCDCVRLFLCSLTKGPLRALPRQLFPAGRSPHTTSRQVARLEEMKNWYAVSVSAGCFLGSKCSMLVTSSTLILAFVDFLFVGSKFLTDFLIATHFQEPDPKPEPEPEGYIWEVYVQVNDLICKLYVRRGISFCPVHHASFFNLSIFFSE